MRLKMNRFKLFLIIAAISVVIMLTLHLKYDISLLKLKGEINPSTDIYNLKVYKSLSQNTVYELDTNATNRMQSNTPPSDMLIFNNTKESITLTDCEIETLRKSQAILKKIKLNCRKNNISTEWNLYEKFSMPRLLIAKPSQCILYGSNPKTGSTSFKHFLYRLDGNYEISNFHRPHGHYKMIRGKHHFSKFFNAQEKFQGYLKVLSIRNPISRIISAFRNKQLRNHNYFKNPEKLNLTDSELFKYFVGSNKMTKWTIDVHRMPQWTQIDICRFPYDMVIQFEEANRYISLLQKLTNSTHVEFPTSRVTKGMDKFDSLYFVHKFFDSLGQPEKEILYQKYKGDFDILGYTKDYEDVFPFLRYNATV